MKTIGKWVAVKTIGLGKEKKSESGIIYTERITNPNIWSEVVSVGEKVTEDIQVGDKVLWDITKGRGNAYGGFDIVHQDNILAVERENS
jgi:co-chaperonin GroES (HSP10)